MKLSKHNEVVEGLQRIERRVKNSIEEGDYDAALLEVLNLYCNDGYSKEETKEWDEKRDTYLEITALGATTWNDFRLMANEERLSASPRTCRRRRRRAMRKPLPFPHLP